MASVWLLAGVGALVHKQVRDTVEEAAADSRLQALHRCFVGCVNKETGKYMVVIFGRRQKRNGFLVSPSILNVWLAFENLTLSNHIVLTSFLKRGRNEKTRRYATYLSRRRQRHRRPPSPFSRT